MERRIGLAMLTLAAAVMTAGCAERKCPYSIDLEPPEIELADALAPVATGGPAFDSPVLSPAGDRLAVQCEVYADRFLPYEVYSLGVTARRDDGTWRPIEIIQHGVYRKYCGRMSMAIQPCFDDTGESLYVTQLTFGSLLRIPCAFTLRSWIERMPWRGGEAERVVEYGDWEFKATELLQHPRVSPDGKWLTFYTRVHLAQQGVYLLNLETNEHVRLGTTHDKHPTWDPSGRRIWFHYVEGGKRHRFDFFARGIERSVIGYYDLHFDGKRLVKWDRVLMDQMGDRFIYHKHPTIVAGMDLLVFHGDLKPDGKKKLLVRRPEPGSAVFEIEPRWEGEKLKAVKHPCSSFGQSDLVFIAKPKGGDDYNLLMALTPEALETVRRVVHEQLPPPQL